MQKMFTCNRNYVHSHFVAALSYVYIADVIFNKMY